MARLSIMIAVFLFTCDTYGQWIGNPATGGLPICTAATSEEIKITVTDDANGAFVVFGSINNNDPTTFRYIYAQHVNSSGQLLWGNAGTPKPVSTSARQQTPLQLVPDGAGGVYVLFSAYLNSEDSVDFYLQHLNSSGNLLLPANGIKVNATNNRERFFGNMVTDGAGGVIVVWSESVYDTLTSLTTFSQAYAQKLNASGVPQWTAGGVQVCTAPGLRIAGSAIADGNGGVIIGLTDTRNSTQLPDDTFNNLDIYAQRINNSGALQWTNAGVPVNTQPFNQSQAFGNLFTTTAIADGSGGMIMVFEDYTGNNDGNPNLYAQRINANGARQWAAAGVVVCATDSTESVSKLMGDGAGGAVICWSDARNGGFFVTGYYAQRITANGVVSWTTNGVLLFEGFSFGAVGFDAVPDAAGSYVYAWTDFATGTLRAQKINGSAVTQWTAGGVDVCTNPNANPVLVQLVPSDNNQIILHWIDSRNTATSDNDIYAAKLTAAGALVNGGVAASFITAANGNWNAPATWTGGVVPTSTSACIVRHNVTVTANASCKSLRVEQPNGRITVNTGVNLTVLQ